MQHADAVARPDCDPRMRTLRCSFLPPHRYRDFARVRSIERADAYYAQLPDCWYLIEPRNRRYCALEMCYVTFANDSSRGISIVSFVIPETSSRERERLRYWIEKLLNPPRRENVVALPRSCMESSANNFRGNILPFSNFHCPFAEKSCRIARFRVVIERALISLTHARRLIADKLRDDACIYLWHDRGKCGRERQPRVLHQIEFYPEFYIES